MAGDMDPRGGPGPSDDARRSEQRRIAEVLPNTPVQDRGEVFVMEAGVVVTFHLPEVEPGELGYHVGTRTLSIWSRRTGIEFRTILVLPVWVKPESYILHHKNGVYEFVMEPRSEALGLPAG